MNGCRMLLITCAGVVLGGTSLGGDATVPRYFPPEFRFVPAEVTFIRPPDDKIAELLASPSWKVAAPVPCNDQTLPVWPDEKTLKLPTDCVNRAKLFAASESVPGATSPARAADSAEGWIRKVIKPEWIPRDLSKALFASQAEKPSESRIVCRWEVVDGNQIQVTQSVATVCVVIRPCEFLRSASRIDEGGPFMCRTFFNQEDTRFRGGVTQLGTSMDKTTYVFVASTSPQPVPPLGHPCPYREWWGWPIWYTDGDAFAFFFPKKLLYVRRKPEPGDPWF